MKKFVAVILGSALTALSAGTVLAAQAAPAEPTGKPAATTPAPVAAPAPAAPAAAATATPPAPTSTAPAAPAGSALEQVKIGIVDMTQVAADSDAGKAAQATLKEKSKALQTRIEAKQKQIEKQKAAIEAKLETLSPKERAAKSKEFQKKVEEYQKLLRSSDQEMQDMQEKLTGDLYQSIKKSAAEYGKAHGFAAIIVKKDILYLSDLPQSKDLTDEITGLLNKKGPAK